MTRIFKNVCTIFQRLRLADEFPAQLAELSIRRMRKAQPSYTIKVITPQDKERVLTFLKRFFFFDEPLNFAVQLIKSPDGRCQELEEYATSTLEHLVSLAAVDENEDYIGVVINGIVRREQVDYTDKSENCPNEKFKSILKLLDHLDREARIWDKLPAYCNVVMEIRMASTHTAWRGRGIMKILCDESERLAVLKGATAMRMDTTSVYSAAIAERLNYKKVYSQVYSKLDFAPQPEAPHLEARVYIKLLKESSQKPDVTI